MNKKLSKFLKVAENKKKALIIPHDHADPDALAAAFGIKTLLKEKLKLSSSISFRGVVGRPENQVLCDYLGNKISIFDELNLDSYDLVILVDCQPGTGNNSLPEGRTADIVIDHHPIEGDLKAVSFADVRTDYGSSSTIVTEYFIEGDLPVSPKLATALLYGIKTDAINFAIKTKEEDLKAYVHLFKLADVKMLNKIESAALPREYFVFLHKALEEAGTFEDVIISDLGPITNPGMIGEFADLFLRLDEVETSLCFGVYNEKLLVSMRTLKPSLNAGRVISYAVGKLGTAGGHAKMAGGQIPLHKETVKERVEHIKEVRERFFNKLGIEGKRKKRIV